MCIRDRDGKIKGCLQALAAEKRQHSEALTVSDRDMLVSLLRKWSKGDESATSSQLRAAELLGKACGLYRDVVEDHRERPSTLVAAELEARLSALLQPSVRPQASAAVPSEDAAPSERVNVVDDQHDAAGSSVTH